jgi:hypothetical protein
MNCILTVDGEKNIANNTSERVVAYVGNERSPNFELGKR